MRESYKKWFTTSISHSIGIADLWSSITGAMLAVLVHFVPQSQLVVTKLAWQVPLWMFAAAVLARVILSPYWIYSAIGNTLTVSVVAVNISGSSSPATSAATSAVIAAQWQSAAPTPDVTSFNAAGTVIVGGNSCGAENALQSWSLTNPDTQTLVFQVRPGDQWSADVGRPGAPNRSEIDCSPQMYTPGTEINISYNFDMTSSTARTDAAGITIGQFHNNDTQLGGATSPTFEVDLQPLDFMSMYIGYLTSSGQPTNTTFFGTQVVNGVSTSYAQLYADPNPIVRNHNYKMQIQIKFTAPGDNSGFVNVWRDGVQIVHSTGQIGFGFNNYWKNGIYGTVTNATQIAQYQNLMVAARPLPLAWPRCKKVQPAARWGRP
jgi:hypothetical protein